MSCPGTVIELEVENNSDEKWERLCSSWNNIMDANEGNGLKGVMEGEWGLLPGS